VALLGDMSAKLDGGKRCGSHQLLALSAGRREDATAGQRWQRHGGKQGACRFAAFTVGSSQSQWRGSL